MFILRWREQKWKLTWNENELYKKKKNYKNEHRQHVETMHKVYAQASTNTHTTLKNIQNEQVNWIEMQCECDATRQNFILIY